MNTIVRVGKSLYLTTAQVIYTKYYLKISILYKLQRAIL